MYSFTRGLRPYLPLSPRLQYGIMNRPSADLLTLPRNTAIMPLDPHQIRPDFPILGTACHQKPLVYLDNAATTQKPRQVIEAESHYYNCQNANIHRGVYTLSQLATELHEQARRKIRQFINAAEDREIIFTRSTTESINLVASSFGRANIKTGDEIIVSGMEHHSNIVPWQILAEQTGAKLKVIPFNDRGELLLDEFHKLLTPRTRIISLVHLSNSLGTINPVEQMIALAHRHGIPVLIDGAQWVAHRPLDVRALDADFYCFSGHKLYGPTGIGVLYGKALLLESMPPYQGGGDMIRSVSFEKTTYNKLPYKFEAGTPDIAGVVGLGAAIDYLSSIGMEAVGTYEHELLEYATKAISSVPGVRLVGTAKRKAAVVSFLLGNVHPHDVGTILDQEGIAIRAGHHCAQPVMDRFGIPATIRVSLALYNTREEIDLL